MCKSGAEGVLVCVKPQLNKDSFQLCKLNKHFSEPQFPTVFIVYT